MADHTATPPRGPAAAPPSPRAAGPDAPSGGRPAGAGRVALLVGGLVLLAAALAAVSVLSVCFGARSVPFATVVDALTAYDPADTDQTVVRSLRVPRTLVGVLAGVALGLAGTVMQGVTRNPLADPGILGINAGAALLIVFAINVLGIGSLSGYVWFGFAGAAVATFTVYGIAAMGRDGATPVRLALSGAAVTAALNSVTTAILLTDVEAFDAFRFWQVGALAGRGMDVALPLVPFIAAGALLALLSGRLLNALALGDDIAAGLGQRVGASRIVAGTAVVLLCGAATAAAGPIAFIGLVIPHMARAITGPDYRWVLPYSALLAPVLLLGADVLGRIIAHPSEVQVGVVTAAIGAPVFVALIRRRRLAEL
ncbi:FecCD family ABC transporter permease [Allonocardiopsis opalescens]|uniref:Iron complex transport system permease protein n=1 Tax=Allonocardiopsis opalescens TaxID=1144618 RepID=A0A2T0PZI0_9ACTN|nr:iron chelate uptake ABC transporter family permease subunit [Allonocardiopsis opalescens]PRX96817.1 iron complex transport system permease protein [Allonocardiopsis opalescens]